MKRPPSKKQWIGLTAQSPRMYCLCQTPQAVYTSVHRLLAVRFCQRCKLVVWR
jgi:hypothetical protein